MPVDNLHEAALVLKGVHDAIDRLLTDVGPALMQHFDVRASVAVPEHDGSRAAITYVDDMLNAVDDRAGYTAFHAAADDLIGLLESIEEADVADAARRS